MMLQFVSVYRTLHLLFICFTCIITFVSSVTVLPSCCRDCTAISLISHALLFDLSIFVVMSLYYFVLDTVVIIDLHSTLTVHPLLVYNIIFILYCGS